MSLQMSSMNRTVMTPDVQCDPYFLSQSVKECDKPVFALPLPRKKLRQASHPHPADSLLLPDDAVVTKAKALPCKASRKAVPL